MLMVLRYTCMKVSFKLFFIHSTFVLLVNLMIICYIEAYNVA